MDPDDVRKPEDLDGLDKNGLIAFLKSEREDKIELWNAWRKANKWEPVDLEGAYLEEAHLEGAHLLEVHLKGAILREAHLEGANLCGAHLEEASLDEAHLEGAVLLGAHLKGVNLGKARLEGTALTGANLEGAYLHSAHLEGADLAATHLEGANLVGAYLERAILRHAHLDGVRLNGARLEGASLIDTHLRDAALAGVADGGLRGVSLQDANFWGVLSLRHDQFLGGNQNAKGLQRLWLGLTNRLNESTIWEETEGRFIYAKDIFKRLKGYFEDAGDYEGANWAYVREQVMEKLMRTPPWLRWLYPRWRGRFKDDFCRPALLEWLHLEFAEKIANYGDSLLRPALWLLAVIVGFALIYMAFGLVTASPECAYTGLERPEWCAPTRNFVDNLLFSLGAMTTTEVKRVQLYQANVGFLMTLETIIGIAITGLLGFVLGNKLRYS